jgi:hypothetical protein
MPAIKASIFSFRFTIEAVLNVRQTSVVNFAESASKDAVSTVGLALLGNCKAWWHCVWGV